MEKPSTHHQLIAALGGPVGLARELGIDKPIPTTVHWHARGIPSRYWHRIVEIAEGKGLLITPRDLEQLSKERTAA